MAELPTLALPVARLGDLILHDEEPIGAIIGGLLSVLVNGHPIARIGDPVFCEIHSEEGAIQVMVSGSVSVFAGGLGVCRVGDLVSCGAVVITGSPNVFSG